MSDSPRTPEEVFPLNCARHVLARYTDPTTDFEPAGAWRSTYGVYTLAGNGGRVGQLALTRRPLDADGFRLTLDYAKDGAGDTVQKVEAEIDCQRDALATPRRWTFRSELLDAAGVCLAGSRLEKSATINGKQIRIEDAAGVESVALPGAWTVNWALFEAVGRLPREPFPALRFTMLDHFDQVKRNQVIAFRSQEQVLWGQHTAMEQRVVELDKGRIHQNVRALVGGQTVALFGYQQLGDGIVPWVYWVNRQGRLVVAISGLEMYLLEEEET